MTYSRKLAFGLAFSVLVATVPSACKKGGFRGEKRAQPQPVAQKQEKSPKETDASLAAKQVKQVVLQLLPTPPDSWWNNCVTVVYKGKTFDAGCSKTGGGLKTLSIPVAVTDSCAALSFQVKTYLNQGNECSKRLTQGLSCEGPYGSVADFDRASDSAAGAAHFRWTHTAAQAESQLAFEDQPSDNIAAASTNAARAEELGIDFNDVGIRIVPQGVNVVVQQTPAQGQTAADIAACK